MIVYEVTICCDGNSCDERVCGEVSPSHVDARGSAKMAAARRDWKFVTPQIYLCESCAKKAGLHAKPNEA